MFLLTNEDVVNIVKQLGYTTVVQWSLNSYSDEILGYLGEYLTLTVEVESKQVLKFFVKCIPRIDELKAKYIIELAFFEKEYGMLCSLFQKFKNGTVKWRPTVYLAKKDVFVLEDVVQLGYTMVRNRDTLTFEEVVACIATMARFHAQSYIYEEQRSKALNRPYRIWEDYRGYLQEPSRSFNWRNAGMQAVIEVLKEYSKFKSHPDFKQKVESTVPKLFDDALSLMKPHSMYRNVVVHRDLWMNNIFFKNGPSGLHALMVDFQTVLYCPPTHDLASFLYFNTRKDFRDQYLNKLINLYYSILHEELAAVNLDIQNIIGKETMNNCYVDSTRFGIIQAALIIPITLVSKEINEKIFNNPAKTQKWNEISRSEEILEIARGDKRYRCHVMELFDEIVEKYIY